MNDKQKAIKEAYGGHWETVKEFISDDGWCKTRKRIDFEKITKNIEIELYSDTTYYWRPLSLQGIETNNGWIKIESHQDLPNDECDCLVYIEGVISIKRYYPIEISHWIDFVTHYQPIVKPLKPIY